MPGQSGNPNGRPKGSRHKTTLAIEKLLDGEGEEITRKAIEKAKEGDMAAILVFRTAFARAFIARNSAPTSRFLAIASAV